MTAGPLPMACPEGHEFNLPNPSFPRVSGLYDPCASLLDTPCPVQPPLALSLSTLPATLTQLSVFIQPHPPLHKPNKACALPRSYQPYTPAIHNTEENEPVYECSAHSHLIVCCFLSIKL